MNIIATALNDAGQSHVVAELSRFGLDWNADAVFTEIENMSDFGSVLDHDVFFETPRGNIYIAASMVMTEIAE